MTKRLVSAATTVALLSVGVIGCGGDGGGDEPPLNPEIPLNQVLTEPESYDEVTVEGTASPAGDLGFVITQQSVSMFVDAKPGVSRGVEDGEDVRVTASVETFSAKKAAEIEGEIELNQGEGDDVAERALADTRIEQGAPYLDLIRLSGSDG